MQHEEAIQEVTRLQAEYSSLLGEHEDLIEKFNNQQSETTRLQAEVERMLQTAAMYQQKWSDSKAELTKAREQILTMRRELHALVPDGYQNPDATQSAPADSQEIQKDRIKGMIATVGGEFAIMIDPANAHFGWTFKRHPDGMWVSGRKATEVEMYAARQHAKSTGQGV